MSAFETASAAFTQATEAFETVSADRDRLATALARERDQAAECRRNTERLMNHEQAKRAEAERHAASVEQDLANVREELLALAARPVALDEVKREVAALTRDLRAAQRESARLASSESALRDRVKASEAALTASRAEAQEAAANECHKGKRRAERLQAEVERLTTVNAGLISRLQVAEDRSGTARRAMLDHAART